MRKKHVLSVVVILSIVLLSSGCHYFVPGAIKRQTSLINLDVSTCLKEIEQIQSDPEKTEREKLEEVNKKALRTLKRLKPQVENVDNYTHGRPASSIEE
jgi:hypothetical protein